MLPAQIPEKETQNIVDKKKYSGKIISSFFENHFDTEFNAENNIIRKENLADLVNNIREITHKLSRKQFGNYLPALLSRNRGSGGGRNPTDISSFVADVFKSLIRHNFAIKDMADYFGQMLSKNKKIK